MEPRLCGLSGRSIGNRLNSSSGCSKLSIFFERSLESTMNSMSRSTTLCRNSLVCSPDPSFIGKMSVWGEERRKRKVRLDGRLSWVRQADSVWNRLGVNRVVNKLSNKRLWVNRGKGFQRVDPYKMEFSFFFQDFSTFIGLQVWGSEQETLSVLQQLFVVQDLSGRKSGRWSEQAKDFAHFFFWVAFWGQEFAVKKGIPRQQKASFRTGEWLK